MYFSTCYRTRPTVSYRRRAMMEARFVIFFLISLASASGWLFKDSAPLKTKCYGKYGCFDNKKPFTRLPQSLRKLATEFRLFTRTSPSFHKIDDSDGNKLRAFDGDKKTVIIVHGFQEHGSASWVKRMKQALLKKEDMNVIVVDWNAGSNPFAYRQATGNTQLVGAQIAELIEFLIRYSHNSASRYHVIGFSLGAHVAGHAGRRLRTEYGKMLGRISGLDPAGPLFKGTSTAARLDSSDASFVDVVHTDSNLFGLRDVSGHIDFYPNGGADQGCKKFREGFFRKLICDHMLAPEYYIASIQNKCSMLAYPCSSANAFAQGSCLSCQGQCPTIGYNSVNSKGIASGKHFLYLDVKSPHCGIKPN